MTRYIKCRPPETDPTLTMNYCKAEYMLVPLSHETIVIKLKDGRFIVERRGGCFEVLEPEKVKQLTELGQIEPDGSIDGVIQ